MCPGGLDKKLLMYYNTIQDHYKIRHLIRVYKVLKGFIRYYKVSERFIRDLIRSFIIISTHFILLFPLVENYSSTT